MYTIVWRLSVIKYNIADFLPDAKISNHAFTVPNISLDLDKVYVEVNLFGDLEPLEEEED